MKKRSFRALWIQRINAAVRAEGLTYGQFIHALKLAGITSTARCSPTSRCTKPKRSARIIAQAKSALPKKKAA